MDLERTVFSHSLVRTCLYVGDLVPTLLPILVPTLMPILVPLCRQSRGLPWAQGAGRRPGASSYAYTHARARARAHARARARAHARARVRAHTHTCVHTYTQLCMRARTLQRDWRSHQHHRLAHLQCRSGLSFFAWCIFMKMRSIQVGQDLSPNLKENKAQPSQK